MGWMNVSWRDVTQNLMNKLFNRPIHRATLTDGAPVELNTRLKKTSHVLLSSATRQSDAVHEALASITQIRSMMAQSETQVTRSLLLAEESSHMNRERMLTIGRLRKAMQGIDESHALLTDLQSAFQEIHSKTKVINNIVSKTKLLSFNASIEAARAGQYGKGFSVVAEEVGRLAQSSGQAAKDIENLVVESQTRALTVVRMVLDRASEASATTQEVMTNFNQMSNAIAEITASLTQISHASREQTVGIERATGAIDKINHAMRMNKESAEEIQLLTAAEAETPVPSPQPFTASFKLATPDAPKVSADDPSFKPQE